MVVTTWRDVRGYGCLCVFLMLAACSSGGNNSSNPSSSGRWPGTGTPDPVPQQPAEPDTDPPEYPTNAPDAGPGSATVAWVPPAENSDGSALVNLRGYEIHFGTRSGTYDYVIRIDNPGITRYVIDGLARGTYYFALTAISGAGIESRFSREASKKI